MLVSLVGPFAATAIVAGLIFIVSFLIGHEYRDRQLTIDKDQAIQDTLDYLMSNGYLKTALNDDGDVEILKADE